MELNGDIKSVEWLQKVCEVLVKKGFAEDITDTVSLLNGDDMPKGHDVKKFQVLVKDPHDFFEISPVRINLRFWYLRKAKQRFVEDGIEKEKEIEANRGNFKISDKGASVILERIMQ